jgi:hypothetical protein
MRTFSSGIRARLTAYLPEYANGTLGAPRTWILERLLTRDSKIREELHHLKSIQSVVYKQSELTPDPSVYGKIRAAVQATPVESKTNWRPSLVWIPIVGLLIVAGIMLWRVLPPGLVIQWSVEGEVPTSFRVYRAPSSSASADDFTLIGELTAEPGVASYGYTDLLLLPGQQFSYRVEGYNPAGRLATSQVMVGNSFEAVPGQVMLLMLITVGGMGVFIFYRQLKPAKQEHGHMALM